MSSNNKTLFESNATISFIDDGSDIWSGINGVRETRPWEDATMTAPHHGDEPNQESQRAIARSDAGDMNTYRDLDGFREHLRRV